MTRSTRRIVGVIAIIVVAAAVGAMWRQRSDFVAIATHRDAAAQPTATSRIIATLVAFDHRLYAGYGDYGSNTGPIVIRAFDPAARRFGEPLLSSQTEAIYTLRWIADRLYAPHIDPAGDAVAGGYAVGEIDRSSGRHIWTDHSPVTATHLFDINSINGDELWLAGSDGADAVVWRSTNRGATWTEALRQPPAGTAPVRYYGIGVAAGHLYVQASDPAGSTSKVFDGNAWHDGPNLLPPGGIFWHPQSFRGRIVYMTATSGLASSPLYSFDGSSPNIELNPTASGEAGPGALRGIYDFAVSRRGILTLGVDHVVRWTDDLYIWHDLARAPPIARSIAILDGRIYLGCADATIHKGPVLP